MSMRGERDGVMDSEWLDRIGSEGLVHLRKFRFWMRMMGVVGIIGYGGIVLVALRSADSQGHLEWLVGALALLAITVTTVIGTRHARWIEKDVARRFSLEKRGSWSINLRSPTGFDETIQKLRVKALERDQKRGRPRWWDH